MCRAKTKDLHPCYSTWECSLLQVAYRTLENPVLFSDQPFHRIDASFATGVSLTVLCPISFPSSEQHPDEQEGWVPSQFRTSEMRVASRVMGRSSPRTVLKPAQPKPLKIPKNESALIPSWMMQQLLDIRPSTITCDNELGGNLFSCLSLLRPWSIFGIIHYSMVAVSSRLSVIVKQAVICYSRFRHLFLATKS